MKSANRMNDLGAGVFAALQKTKRELAAAGAELTDFSIGSPNIPPGGEIRALLASEALKAENYVYPVKEKPELLEAAAAWYKNRFGVELNADSELMSLCGAHDALAHLCLAFIDEGDTVLIPEPAYPGFMVGPRLAGADIYQMTQSRATGGLVDFKAIPAEVAKKAKLMLVSYPSNPLTSMADDAFYMRLIEFARSHDITVVHDNAYADIVFDGRTGRSFLEYDGAREVGIELTSLSKTYGMAGARVGFAAGNREVLAAFRALKFHLDYNIFLPIQEMAIAALSGPQDCVSKTRDEYQRRRDRLLEGLAAIGWSIEKPPATIFVWAKIPDRYGENDLLFAEELARKAGVLVVPGRAFGPSGKGYVRFALVVSDEETDAAVARIHESGILT